jgi:hypothetical protein
MLPDFVQALAFALVKFVLEILWVSILEGKVHVLKAVWIMSEVIESCRPERKMFSQALSNVM